MRFCSFLHVLPSCRRPHRKDKYGFNCTREKNKTLSGGPSTGVPGDRLEEVCGYTSKAFFSLKPNVSSSCPFSKRSAVKTRWIPKPLPSLEFQHKPTRRASYAKYASHKLLWQSAMLISANESLDGVGDYLPEQILINHPTWRWHCMPSNCKWTYVVFEHTGLPSTKKKEWMETGNDATSFIYSKKFVYHFRVVLSFGSTLTQLTCDLQGLTKAIWINTNTKPQIQRTAVPSWIYDIPRKSLNSFDAHLCPPKRSTPNSPRSLW